MDAPIDLTPEPEMVNIKLEIKVEEEINANQDPETIFRSPPDVKPYEVPATFQPTYINPYHYQMLQNAPVHQFQLTLEPKEEINYPEEQRHTFRTEEIQGKVYENGKINRIVCPHCNSDFKNRANLKRHLKFVHSTEADIVECKECYRTFKSIAHLRSHNSSVHADNNLMNCNICFKTFLNKKKLNNHLFYAHPSPEEAVSCSVCNKSFKSKYSLKIHLKQVHSENTQVKCEHCDKDFKNEMLLQRHIKWSHPADGMVYKCQQCGRVLPSISCYKKHIENVHSKSEVQCQLCSKTFKTAKTLSRHEKNIHGDAKTEQKVYKTGDLECPECNRKFVKNTTLSWHYEQCHSENKRSNTCHLCDKEYSDNASLKRHVETSHSMDYVTCHLCQKEFKSQVNLQRHLAVTHAPPEAAQKCDICQKMFKCAMHLRIHINAVHSTEGTFTCDVCEKQFSSKKYMIKHKKTHVETKEFPCLICHKFFKSQWCVTKHARRVHGGGVESPEWVLGGPEGPCLEGKQQLHEPNVVENAENDISSVYIKVEPELIDGQMNEPTQLMEESS